MSDRRRIRSNPFEFGSELGADEIVNREDEIAEVVRAIRDRGKLFLIGPRRYGKTSILKAASERARREGMLVLRYNVEAFPSLEDLLGRIVIDGARLLAKPDVKARQRLRDIFSRLEPKFTFDLEGEISASLGVKAETEPAHIPLIVDALDGLDALAAKQDQPVGLILDEFQKIIEAGGKSAEGQIRAAVQQHRNVAYVFAGSKTRLLAAMTGEAARPFYRLGARIFLGPVPRERFAAAIGDSFKGAGLHFDAEAIETIITLAEEVPYNVQRLAHASWEYLAKQNQPRLTTVAVKAALELVIRRDDPYYTQIWNSLSPPQKKALLAVIRAKGVNLLSRDTLREAGLPSSTMQQATKALKNKEILRDEESLGLKQTKFDDPFFATWIRMITRQ
jgi:hypothetical protein